jgi:hypothetical protein
MLTFVGSIIFGWFHYVDVADVTDISEVHAAFILRFRVCKVGEFCVYIHRGSRFEKSN